MPYSYPGGHTLTNQRDQERFQRMYGGAVPTLQSMADDATMGYTSRQAPVKTTSASSSFRPMRVPVPPRITLNDMMTKPFDEDNLRQATAAFKRSNPWVLP